jgi:protein associated with RNAse G/E
MRSETEHPEPVQINPDGKTIDIYATFWDGAPHWQHPARLVAEDYGLWVTETSAGLQIVRDSGASVYEDPFDTRACYWPDRWYNVIRLVRPGRGLVGWYCNVATPAIFDGSTLSYVDLQLDVFVRAGDTLTHELRDEDEFLEACERYRYSEEVIRTARAAVDELVGLVQRRDFPFDA